LITGEPEQTDFDFLTPYFCKTGATKALFQQQGKGQTNSVIAEGPQAKHSWCP